MSHALSIAWAPVYETLGPSLDIRLEPNNRLDTC